MPAEPCALVPGRCVVRARLRRCAPPPATLPWHRGGRELSSLVSPSESSPWALPLVTPASWQPPGGACVLVVLRHEAKPLQSSNKD